MHSYKPEASLSQADHERTQLDAVNLLVALVPIASLSLSQPLSLISFSQLNGLQSLFGLVWLM